MWFVCAQKNGVSAPGLQRVLSFGSYETASAWPHRLRRDMGRPGRDLLGEFGVAVHPDATSSPAAAREAVTPATPTRARCSSAPSAATQGWAARLALIDYPARKADT